MRKGKGEERRLTGAVKSKLEDEIDASESIASLADTEGTLPLEIYIDSRNSRLSS